MSTEIIESSKNCFVCFFGNARTKNLLILEGNRAMRNGEWIKKLTCFHLVAVHYFKENKTLRRSFDKQSLINFHGKQSLMVLSRLRLFWNIFTMHKEAFHAAFSPNSRIIKKTNDMLLVRNKQSILEAKR